MQNPILANIQAQFGQQPPQQQAAFPQAAQVAQPGQFPQQQYQQQPMQAPGGFPQQQVQQPMQAPGGFPAQPQQFAPQQQIPVGMPGMGQQPGFGAQVGFGQQPGGFPGQAQPGFAAPGQGPAFGGQQPGFAAQPVNIDAMLSGVESAQVSTRYPRLNAGHLYALRLERVEFKNFREGGSGMIAEFRVENSDDPGLPPGSYASHLIAHNDNFAGNVQQFGLAFLGIQGSAPEAAQYKPYITPILKIDSGNAPPNPQIQISMIGRIAGARAERRESKKRRNQDGTQAMYTLVTFTPMT